MEVQPVHKTTVFNIEGNKTFTIVNWVPSSRLKVNPINSEATNTEIIRIDHFG
jgi:hypothetical protein